MATEGRDKSRLFKDIENIVEETRARAETLGESIRETVQAVMSSRDNVVMVRVNKDTLTRLDELVEAGILNSRSEAAAFLIAEGIKARRDLFDKISEKIQQIRRTREELRKLLDEEPPTPR
jgi:Arc/MetJ-type ribon-helix-helix transcriptional regulator